MTRTPQPNPQPSDDIDALLRAYFQAELPKPWPAFRPPVSSARVLPFRSSQRQPVWARRTVLVAAALLLLAAGLLIPRRTATHSERPGGAVPILGAPSASPRSVPAGPPAADEPDKLHPQPPRSDPKNQTGIRLELDRQ